MIMTGNTIETSDAANALAVESALIPTYNTLSGGSSNPPKFGTLIPNRIFVGGIPSNTTEQELKTFFSNFGQVKDVKIINDRHCIAKGSYGFVTFENQETADKIIKNESETLVFKDRKLNIGHAIRKQQIYTRSDLQPTIFFAGGAIPYAFQNGMTVIPISGQDYSMFAPQANSPYAMMLSQTGANNGLYLSPLQSAAAAAGPASAYAPFGHQTGAQLTPQQFPQTNATSGLNPAVVGQFASPQTNSNAAVISAMATAIQWPQQNSNQAQLNSPHLINGMSVRGVNQTKEMQNTSGQNSLINQHQAAAVAAALVAQQQQQQQQQNTWAWSPGSNHVTRSSQSVLSSVVTSGVATSTVQPSHHQQGLASAPVTPATYLYSPLTPNGHELMFFHQTSSPFMAGNSTSDYSTDYSAHSSSNLESAECDGTPLGRHAAAQLGAPFASTHGGAPLIEGSCVPSYTAFTSLMDLQPSANCMGPQNPAVAPVHLHQLRQPHQQAPAAAAAATFVASQQTHGSQQLVSLVNGSPAFVASNQPAKMYTANSVVHHPNNTYPLTSFLFGNQSLKNESVADFNSAVSQNNTANVSNSNSLTLVQNTVNSQAPTAALISSSG